MKTELIRTAVAIRKDQMERLSTLSKVTGAPVAELIRRAVDGYLELRKSELKHG